MLQILYFTLRLMDRDPKEHRNKTFKKNDIFEAWALEELSGNYLSDIRGDFEKYNL